MQQHEQQRLQQLEQNVATLTERSNAALEHHKEMKDEIDDVWSKVNEVHGDVARLDSRIGREFAALKQALKDHINQFRAQPGSEAAIKRTPGQEWVGRSPWIGVGLMIGSAVVYVIERLLV